jgi:hypothetical protein
MLVPLVQDNQLPHQIFRSFLQPQSISEVLPDPNMGFKQIERYLGILQRREAEKVWFPTVKHMYILIRLLSDHSSGISDDYNVGKSRAIHLRYLQTAIKRPEELSDISEVPDSEEDARDDSESEFVPARKRAKQNSNALYRTNSGRPMQLEFYQGIWVEILQHAKKLFCVWLVTTCPWPERDEHLVNAEDCLTAAVKEYRKQGSTIKEGISWFYGEFSL